MQTPVHIFIVENQGIFPQLLEYVFTKDTRFRFLHFKNGEDCVNNLHLEPDIILLRSTLPGIGGIEVLNQVKEFNPDINVVMLLDDHEHEHKLDLEDAGADDILMRHHNNEIANIIQSLEVFLKKHVDWLKDEYHPKPSLKAIKVSSDEMLV